MADAAADTTGSTRGASDAIAGPDSGARAQSYTVAVAGPTNTADLETETDTVRGHDKARWPAGRWV